MPINSITQNITAIPPAGKRGVDVQTIFVNKQEAFQDALTGVFVGQINTLRTQLNTFVSETNTVVTQVNTNATNASTSATTATTQAGIATTKAGEANTSASQALNYRNQAETFAQQAQASASSVDANNIVHRTGNEDVGGIKNFLVSPIVPTPISTNDATNKQYVDTKVSKVISTDNAVVRFDGTTGEVQNSNIFINDNGNVGIGTTPNPNYSLTTIPNYTGSVFIGDVCIGKSGANFGSIGYNFITKSTSNNYSYNISSLSSMIRFDNGGFTFHTAPSGTAGNTISYTNVMNLSNNGNLLLTSGTGALGYGAGAGGTVTQLTSKSTAVTLNKPTGIINTHNAPLASGGIIVFILNNSVISQTDTVIVDWNSTNYRVWGCDTANGTCVFIVQNVSTNTLSETLAIQFNIIKGSVS